MRTLKLRFWKSKVLILSALQGCITVEHYHPLNGLQRSYLVSYQDQNFKGLNLSLGCQNSPTVDRDQAEALCAKMASLFESQGAKIQDRNSKEAANNDLNITFTGKKLYEIKNEWMWVLSILTWTLFPVEQEFAIEQTMTVADNSGQRLNEVTFQARFVQVWGAGYWLANKVLNWTVRNPTEKVDEDSIKKDFSADFYSQVSQTLFNASALDALKKRAQR